MVSGARTKSGKPLLANDPHLRLEAPAVWYLVHLALSAADAETNNVVGASIPGMPRVVLGRSDRVAWGFTNTGPDVQDVFIEKVNPDNPREYLTPDGWRPFAVEDMAIAVKGAGTRNVPRRRTRHGPVLPGFYYNLQGVLGTDHVAALKWTALSDDDTTIAAGMLDPKMRTVADYMESMHLFVAPMQSMVAADTDGAIGLIAPGRVPVRDPKNKVAGRAPVPGWDATYDWKGYLKLEELPRVLDAGVDAIGTANARMVDPDYPHHLTFDWEAPFRQQRIKELIFDKDEHDMASMRDAQLDVISLAIVKLLPLMISAAQGRRLCRPGRARSAHHLGWGHARRPVRAVDLHRLDARGGEGRLWRRPRRRLRPLSRLSRLGADPAARRPRHSARLVRRPHHTRARNLCHGDGDSPEQGTARSGGPLRQGPVAVALGHGSPRRERASPVRQRRLVGTLLQRRGPDPRGQLHAQPRQGRSRRRAPFANKHAASFRAIYDLADLERSLYIQTTGQSGNPFSPFYRSFARRWAEGKYIEIPTKREAIAKVLLGTWTLTPQP